MYCNENIFPITASRFKKVSVLVNDAPWEHYENARVYISELYIVISETNTNTQVLLPRESIKAIMTEGKYW